MKRHVWIAGLIALTLTACSAADRSDRRLCDLTVIDETALTNARETDFETMSQSVFDDQVMALSQCLGHIDPSIRDELAYGTLTAMLRSGKADPDLLRTLRDRLYEQLDSADPHGVLHPFAALVLSEVARVDRISAFLSDDARQTMVESAAQFLSSETDYRGFSDIEGWRHNIAHGADWLMQLALNPAITDTQRLTIIEAVASQVQASNGHAYIYGEAERLARPYLFAAMQGSDDESVWQARLGSLADPAPMTDWSEAFQSENGLARLHNLKMFLRILLVNVSNSQNPSLQAMRPAILSVMRTLPT